MGGSDLKDRALARIDSLAATQKRLKSFWKRQEGLVDPFSALSSSFWLPRWLFVSIGNRCVLWKAPWSCVPESWMSPFSVGPSISPTHLCETKQNVYSLVVHQSISLTLISAVRLMRQCNLPPGKSSSGRAKMQRTSPTFDHACTFAQNL